MHKPQAILLPGPTGSGKTPLGELLQRRGLWGRPCRHFDFGQQLRQAAEGGGPADLSEAERAFIHSVLASGALLEDEQFGIAEKLLRGFLAEGQARSARPASGAPRAEALLVLNGLPRHAGQAKALDALLDVRAIVELCCTARVVLQRIAHDAGGDRAGRADDDEAAVRQRLATYRQRTALLVGFYRRRGAAVRRLDIGERTTAEDALATLQAQPAPELAAGGSTC